MSTNTKQKSPHKHQKKQFRKVAPLKLTQRTDPITNRPFRGTGKTVFVDAPEGVLQSSSHVTKRSATVQLNNKLSNKNKYFKTRGSLGRDLRAFQYKRPKFPNQIFTMLCPGGQIPKDVSIFKVPLNMNRIQVKDYLEELYGVSVVKVNTTIVVGKRKLDRYYRYVKEADWKKAYVRTTDSFSFPWPRPISYSLTDNQKKAKIADEKKKKEERQKEYEAKMNRTTSSV